MQDPSMMSGSPMPQGMESESAQEMLTCPQCGCQFPEAEGLAGGMQGAGMSQDQGQMPQGMPPPAMPPQAAPPPMDDAMQTAMSYQQGGEPMRRGDPERQAALLRGWNR